MELRIVSGGNRYVITGACKEKGMRRFNITDVKEKDRFTATIFRLSDNTPYSEDACKELWHAFNECDTEALTMWSLTYGASTQ